MNLKSYIFTVVVFIAVSATLVFAQSRSGKINLQTEPNATVWIDGLKRGVTDEEGKLEITPIKRGARRLKVRAYGFKEISKRLLVTQRGAMRIRLIKTTSPAELAFQEAEKILPEDKIKAIELYRKAVKLRPRYGDAYIALARALTGSDNPGAHKAIAKARRIRAIYPEASAVEGRVFRSENDLDKAIDSFDRAVREGRGFQPEAHTGLGLIFKGEAESAAAASDFEDEKYYYGEAAKSFEKAIDQLSATEPVLYILLGAVYEKMEENQKAIAVYERFLRDFPTDNERTAVESFIVQIKREISDEQ